MCKFGSTCVNELAANKCAIIAGRGPINHVCAGAYTAGWGEQHVKLYNNDHFVFSQFRDITVVSDSFLYQTAWH